MDNKQIEQIATVLESIIKCEPPETCENCSHKYTENYSCNSERIATILFNTGCRKQIKGKWIVTERGCVITCSNCKERVELYYPDGTPTGLLPYCPCCGSKNKEN